MILKTFIAAALLSLIHEVADAKVPPISLQDTHWLHWLKDSTIFPEYNSIPKYGQPVNQFACDSTLWNEKYDKLRFSKPFACTKTQPPDFSTTWMETINFCRNNARHFQHFIVQQIQMRLRPAKASKQKYEAYKNTTVQYIPQGFGPADFPGVNTATLEQFQDLYDFWSYVLDDNGYKSCEIFIEKHCGSSLEFCNKPNATDRTEKEYTDVCAEERVDVNWVTLKHNGVNKDCWVVPGQNLYYTECFTPKKKDSIKCHFGYRTFDDHVCVPSAMVKRKVWTLCQLDPPGHHTKDNFNLPDWFNPNPAWLGRAWFNPVLFETTVPTACSCKKCECCQYNNGKV